MNKYEDVALKEMLAWQRDMQKEPKEGSAFAKEIQNKINGLIPDKAHEIITEAIKVMVKAVLLGSDYTANPPVMNEDLESRETKAREKIDFYRKTAAVSGAKIGSGGIILGLADLPVLISIKMKFLFDLAGIYGFDARNYKERLYMLYVFQLTFSSQQQRKEVFKILHNWDSFVTLLPSDKDYFDWRTFQQEYRDYIDVAKMLQLVPGIGAIVGAYSNYKLVDKLGEIAMNAYRLRVFKIEE